MLTLLGMLCLERNVSNCHESPHDCEADLTGAVSTAPSALPLNPAHRESCAKCRLAGCQGI